MLTEVYVGLLLYFKRSGQLINSENRTTVTWRSLLTVISGNLRHRAVNLSIYRTVKLFLRIVKEAMLAYSDIQSWNVYGKTGKLRALSDRIVCDDVTVQTWDFTNKNIERYCYNNSLDASKFRNT